MTMMPSEQIGALSNFWWATVANDFSITIFLTVTLIMTVLKIWAVMKPSNKTNSIICLVASWLYDVPGMKKNEKGDPVSPEIPEATK